MRILFLLVIVFYFTSCTNSSPSYTIGDGDNKSQAAEGVEHISVADASTLDCPTGGKVYTLYIDMNANRLIDVDESTISTQIVCNGLNGSNGTNGTNGTNGANGADGTNGSNGYDGYSTVLGINRMTIDALVCASESGLQIESGLDFNRNHILDGNEIQQTELLCDGQNGTNGTNGTNGMDAPNPQFTPIEAILPCGSTVAYKEVLLLLNNGQVLASFSESISGLNTRLSLIPDGTYMNTDGSGCTFSLSTSGNQRSISWFNQVQKTWTVTP